MDEIYVKNYFSRAGTVSTWWEPEERDKSHIFQREIQAIGEMLEGENSSNALDVACGKGRISRMLNQRGLNTISLDISKEMLDIGCERGDIVNPRVGDGEKLPFGDSKFDVVACMDALVHFPNPARAVEEAYNALRKGGIYLCNTSNPYDLGYLPRSISRGIRKLLRKDDKNKGEEVFRYISPKEMKNILKSQKFSVEEERKLGILAPIEVRGLNGRDIYVFSESFSRSLEGLDKVLERMPAINRLAIMSVYKARK